MVTPPSWSWFVSVFKMLDSSVRISGYFKEKLFQVVSVFKQFSVSRI